MRHRPLTADDTDLLTEAVYACQNWSVGRFTSTEQVSIEQVRHDPLLTRYRTDPRTDLALVAGRDDGRAVAVAWLTFGSGDNPGRGFVGPSIPELMIAVPDINDRSAGTGGELLTALLGLARKRGIPGVSLAVEPDNPARDLFERHGFQTVGFAAELEIMLLV